MIQVQTNRPVFSNANGDVKNKLKKVFTVDKEKQAERKKNRAERKSERKAKRNAKRLERKNTPKGNKFTLKLSKVFKKGTKTEKKNPDGSTTEVPAKDIVTTPQGSFDKVEVAKATGVKPEQVTPEFIAKNSVASPNGEVSIIVPDTLVGTDDGGNPYLAEDLQDASAPIQNVVDEDQKKRGMTKTEKILLFSGIGVAVLIVGIIVYRKISK